MVGDIYLGAVAGGHAVRQVQLEGAAAAAVSAAHGGEADAAAAGRAGRIEGVVGYGVCGGPNKER